MMARRHILLSMLKQLLDAAEELRGLTHYLPGCPHPDCLVCKRNKETLERADTTIALVKEHLNA